MAQGTRRGSQGPQRGVCGLCDPTWGWHQLPTGNPTSSPTRCSHLHPLGGASRVFLKFRSKHATHKAWVRRDQGGSQGPGGQVQGDQLTLVPALSFTRSDPPLASQGSGYKMQTPSKPYGVGGGVIQPLPTSPPSSQLLSDPWLFLVT